MIHSQALHYNILVSHHKVRSHKLWSICNMWNNHHNMINLVLTMHCQTRQKWSSTYTKWNVTAQAYMYEKQNRNPGHRNWKGHTIPIWHQFYCTKSQIQQTYKKFAKCFNQDSDWHRRGISEAIQIGIQKLNLNQNEECHWPLDDIHVLLNSHEWHMHGK